MDQSLVDRTDNVIADILHPPLNDTKPFTLDGADHEDLIRVKDEEGI